MSKKEVITIDQSGFDRANGKFQDYQKKANRVSEFILEQTGVEFSPEECKQPDSWRKFLNKYAEAHKDANTLKLKPIKLLELQEVDINRIVEIFDQLKLHTQKEKPSIEHYTTYAENEAERERLQQAKDLESIIERTGTNYRAIDQGKSPLHPSGQRNVGYIKQSNRY